MDYDFLGLPNQPQTMDLVNMVLQMEKHFPSEFHDYPQSVIDFSSATGMPPNSQYPITATYPPGTSILQQGGAPPNSAFYPELGLGAPTGDLNNNNNEADDCSNGSTSPNSKRAASMAAMREMIFRIAAMQPVHIDPESVKAPRRRNVRISKDPQSVAARHRRERISERIRILQRLVPGGTKMDTASMLDEAIHYVKFLKDQVQTLERAATTGGPHPWLAQQQQHVMPGAGAGAGAGGGAYGGPQGGPGSCGSSGNSSPLSSSTSSPPHYSGGGGSSDNNNIYNHQQYVASAAGDMYNNHHHQPHHLYDEHQQYINSTTTAYMFR